MAEPVSSIITIAMVGIALVKGCKNYIDGVRKVDNSVDRLLSKVTELHGVVRLLNSKYYQAEPDGTSEPSLLVREKITQCRNRLRDIKPRISELKAQNTETFAEKAALKRKMDAVAKDIEFAMDDIRRYLTDIVLVTGACSYLEFTSYIRRVSETMASSPTIQGSNEGQPTQDDPSSLNRWLSNAETILEPVNFRRNSTTTLPSRSSVSSSSSRALLTQSDDDESVLSNQPSITLKPNEDWRAFHYTVSQCKDDPALVEEIRSTLEQHPEPSALVNILGDHRRAPLHLAAMRGYVKLARILLAFGGDLDAKDTQPASVLDHAVANKQVDFVTLILDKGVDETAILERNMNQLKKIKNIIALRKKREQGSTREGTRTFRWTIGRQRSN